MITITPSRTIVETVNYQGVEPIQQQPNPTGQAHQTNRKCQQNRQICTNAQCLKVHQYIVEQAATMITYDSGADGHYLSERDRAKVGLPILRPSTKRVGVANGGSSKAKHVTALPFKHLSAKANRADSFQDFPNSLMSVGIRRRTMEPFQSFQKMASRCTKRKMCLLPAKASQSLLE